VIFSSLCGLLAALLVSSGAPGPHPMSRSSSRVDIEGEVVRWTLRVQPESVREVLPLLDANGDGVLQKVESEAGANQIAEYLALNFGLRDHEEMVAEWAGDLIGIGVPIGTEEPGDSEWIEASWEFRAPAKVEGLGVRMELFKSTSPDHIDVFELRQGGQLSYTALFSAAQPGAWIPDVGEGVIGVFEWFLWGLMHILTGYDHLAFLLALLMCVRGAKHAVIVVTSFTVAHSVTLAVAAYGFVQISDRFVELVIALSIVFVASGGFSERPRRWVWLEAGLFGLIHGLGFAGFVRDSVSGVDQGLLSLASFNVGVEVGQLGFLAPIALVLEVWRRRRSPQEAHWVPMKPRRVLSVCLGAAGFFWFLERAGWLGPFAS